MIRQSRATHPIVYNSFEHNMIEKPFGKTVSCLYSYSLFIICVCVNSSSSLLYILCKCITIYLSILLLMDTEAVSSFFALRKTVLLRV